MVFVISNFNGGLVLPLSVFTSRPKPQALSHLKNSPQRRKMEGGHPKSCPKFRSAGEGHRTLVSSLEGYSFTITLHPHERRPTLCACGFLPSAFSRPSRLANRGGRH